MKSKTTRFLAQLALSLALLALLLPLSSCAGKPAQPVNPDAFVTVWKGVAGEPLQIPLVGHYTVTWYEATNPQERHTETVSISPESPYAFAHPYSFTPPRDGEYVLEVAPEGVEYMQMWAQDREDEEYHFGSAKALLRVEQFGKVQWKNMKAMFAGCENMTFADTIDTPDLSKVYDMQYLFADCRKFNSPLEGWKVGRVNNMKGMFKGCETFNQPLDAWDVSQVENMEMLFSGCRAFNQSLATWDVANVLGMAEMFAECEAFNQPLGNWDVKRVVNMRAMFWGCRLFNQPLEAWNVSRVENMAAMFAECAVFNQPLGKWNVSKVTDMASMFRNCRAFDQLLDTWQINDDVDMYNMFKECPAGEQPVAHTWYQGPRPH